MNFRAFLLFLGVFLSVLSHRSCYIENVEADSGPNPSSNDQNNPQDENEKSNEGLSDLSTSTRSILSTQVASLSSSPSSSSSYLITDTESESIDASSSEQTISSSELEQLVLPTIAPATPHFDTESSISSSVILRDTETINQEKKPIEDEKQQHDSVPMSNIESQRKEIETNKEKENRFENVGNKPIDEDDVKDEIPEKPQENRSQELTSEPQGEEKVSVSVSVSVFKDKEVTKEPIDEEDETKRKEDKPKDREDDSITAELKQAEEETKPASEEMPSFDEFKRQHLQEEEKQKNILKQQKEVKVGPETFSKPKTRKIKERKQNNYASLDCGAKILKANTEASNIFSILQDNRDLYMLNPCSTKIWFIVELCDNVQVKTIEIANFELFSSTPESFKVYVSGRYPTREWTLLGTFQARDERNLQSFPLDEPIYAKYIKVEMLSHFGSEHYCPLSLFRVFGISMMEELEDHEAGGQDDGDAVDHDDDVAQVLPPDPSVKEEDKTTKSTTNILATVGDTLFNIVKVAAKKLTGVIDSEKNLMSDNLGVSTAAPSSGIVSSVTRKGKDAKPSIVTLIPSDDEDDKIHGSKHENIANNDTSFTNTKTREGLKETKQENTTFYNKIHSDSSSGHTTSSAAFTSCELLVRMLGQTGFGCMMGNVLYSKRKNSGFTPREDGPRRQKPKAPPRSHSRPETTTDKEKEDSKKNDEKKERKEESGKAEEKGKKSGKGNFDNGNKEPTVQKEDNKISSKSVNELNEKGSSVETKKSSEVNTVEASIDNVQTSINGSTDPVSMVKPSEMQPTIMKPCDPTPDDKGTPTLSSLSVLNTQPSSHITQSKISQFTGMGVEPTLNQAQKAKERSSETETRTATDDNPYIQPDVKDEVNVGEGVRKDVDGESTTSKEEKSRSSTTSTVEQSDIRDTCDSVDSSDNLLIKPSQSTSPSECKVPSATGSKDVDVLEFKILDSAGREGTAHLETLDEPDKPVKPDEPINGEEPIKESKEKDKIDQSDSTSVSDSATSPTLYVSDKDESVVSTLGSSVEPSKPSIAVVPAATTEPLEPEQPTTPPDVNTNGESESISPLSPPPAEVPLVPPTSTIEASLTDDISSVLNKVPNSAGVGGQGLASSGTQKESIFMRLTNRIKALEQNLTLSTLYMEKLNQKYRKIIEEMQKNFDKKVNLLTNATRKAEAVIKHQKEQISNLQDKTDKTSRDMKQFNRRLESLNIQVMERHIIGLFLEVILIMILFVVFRRWDRARIRRDILRESRMNGKVLNSYDYSSHTESSTLGRILNGQLSGREQLRRSFSNPSEPESIGTLGSESVTHTQKDEFSPLLDAKKKRNRKRPKSVILTSETSQPTTVSEPTNQPSPNSIISVTAGLLFSPARGFLNGFKRSQSLDDCQSNQKTSLPSTSRLKKTKSLNVIPENTEQMSASFSLTNTKKGSRIPTPPPPPPTQKYWTAGSTDGLYQKAGQQPSSLKLTQKKGRGLNGANPYT